MRGFTSALLAARIFGRGKTAAQSPFYSGFEAEPILLVEVPVAAFQRFDGE